MTSPACSVYPFIHQSNRNASDDSVCHSLLSADSGCKLVARYSATSLFRLCHSTALHAGSACIVCADFAPRTVGLLYSRCTYFSFFSGQLASRLAPFTDFISFFILQFPAFRAAEAEVPRTCVEAPHD